MRRHLSVDPLYSSRSEHAPRGPDILYANHLFEWKSEIESTYNNIMRKKNNYYYWRLLLKCTADENFLAFRILLNLYIQLFSTKNNYYD